MWRFLRGYPDWIGKERRDKSRGSTDLRHTEAADIDFLQKVKQFHILSCIF